MPKSVVKARHAGVGFESNESQPNGLWDPTDLQASDSKSDMICETGRILQIFFSMIRCFVPGYIDRVLHKTLPYMFWQCVSVNVFANDAFTMLFVLRKYSQSTTGTHAHSKI